MKQEFFASFFGTADILTPTQLEGCFSRKSHHRCFPPKTQFGMYGVDISAVPAPAAVADVRHNPNSTP